jgi:hypothetical protein
MTEAELWRDIPGWVGYYQVSNYGRVRSVRRNLVRSNGFRYRVRGKVLKPIPVNGRPQHLAVTLARDGQTSGRLISTLVREVWGELGNGVEQSGAAA